MCDTEQHTYKFSLYYNRDKIGYVGIDIIDNTASLHLIFTKFTPGIYKELQEAFKSIKSFIRSTGCSKLVATNYEYENRLWIKFIKLFGFDKVVSFSIQEL